jgi:hypothetical protein
MLRVVRPSPVSEGVEELSPLLTGEVEIEVPEWADAATGEWELPRHALDERRVKKHIATLDLTERAPRQVATIATSQVWRL